MGAVLVTSVEEVLRTLHLQDLPQIEDEVNPDRSGLAKTTAHQGP